MQQLHGLQQACKELQSGIASRRFQKRNMADSLAQLETQVKFASVLLMHALDQAAPKLA